jgi:hypothetical protein
MARDSAGKWVTRAASTGGGRTYRGQVPVNWYLALVLIVIVGLGSVIYSRYEYRKASPAASTVEPVIGTTWFSALGMDICGSQATLLPTNTNASKVGLTTSGNGVIVIDPKTSGEAGNNATLGKFVSEYPGMALNATSFTYPGQQAVTTGQKCTKGTPDAGKTATLQVEYWTNFETKTGTAVADPTALKLGNNSLVTIAFLPQGKKIPKPPGTVITNLITQSSGGTGSTTPTSVVTTPSTTTPTTAPSATTTTQPTTTTTQ